MTTTPAPTDLDALKALERAATPAPWKADTETRGDCVLWGPDGQFVANAQSEPHWLPAADGGKRAVMFDVDRRDVALIEAMRNNWTALLDELVEARDEEERYRQEARDSATQAGRAIRERDAVREELAKVRAELNAANARIDRTLAELTNPMWFGLLDDDTAKLASEIVALLHVDANPATTAEPADEPYVAVGGDKIGDLVMDALHAMTPREISDRIRSQPCLTCGVPAGEQCRSQSGPRAASHVERLRIFTEAMRAQVVTEPATPKATCSCKWSPVQGRIWCDPCAAARDSVLKAAAEPAAG